VESDTNVREIHDTNQKAPERVHNTKHESRGAGKETRGLEERQARSRIGGRVSERLEGAEIVGIRGKRGEKGDIITKKTNKYLQAYIHPWSVMLIDCAACAHCSFPHLQLNLVSMFHSAFHVAPACPVLASL